MLGLAYACLASFVLGMVTGDTGLAFAIAGLVCGARWALREE